MISFTGCCPKEVEGAWWEDNRDGHAVHDPSQGVAGHLQQYQHEVPDPGWETWCPVDTQTHREGTRQ